MTKSAGSNGRRVCGYPLCHSGASSALQLRHLKASREGQGVLRSGPENISLVSNVQAMGPLGRPLGGDWSDAAASPLCLPILGLKLAELRGEPWLDSYSQSREAMQDWGVRTPTPPHPTHSSSWHHMQANGE